jgi:copper homeostasis protein
MEIEIMKEDIQFCIEIGCTGVVTGCLNSDRTINWEHTEQLLDKAGYLDFTFHRAFDHAPNPFEALETIRDLGIQRVLTSGSKTSAADGIEVLAELIDEADDDVIIMPGGGVRPENLKSILSIGANEIHSSGLKSGEITTNIEVVRQLKLMLS